MKTFDSGTLVHKYCYHCKKYNPIQKGYGGWIVDCVDCDNGSLFNGK